MNDSPDRHLTRPYVCRDCGSEVGFRSRRRTATEKYILPLFLLQPVRCAECFRRDYRLIFTQVRERLADGPLKMTPAKVATASPAKVATGPKRNVA
jgi:hypothetical protein